MSGLPAYRLIKGNAHEVLALLPDESAQCVITSPPYYGLRNYHTEPQIWGGNKACHHEWVSTPPPRKRSPDDVKDKNSKNATNIGASYEAEGGDTCTNCGAWRGHLGLEPTPEMYLQHLVSIFREMKRVLSRHGTFWLNIGDSYVSGKSRDGSVAQATHGFKNKDCYLIPERLVIALQEDGWWVRSKIIWAKGLSFCPAYAGTTMPESVNDRPTVSHEYIYLLTRSSNYAYYADAIRERGVWPEGTGAAKGSGHTRNVRTVWAINPNPYAGAHFATFPPSLVRPMILAGTMPGDTVLDPFSGSGTTGVVAGELGRCYVGIELNPDYIVMAERRLSPVYAQGSLV